MLKEMPQDNEPLCLCTVALILVCSPHESTAAPRLRVSLRCLVPVGFLLRCLQSQIKGGLILGNRFGNGTKLQMSNATGAPNALQRWVLRARCRE